MRCKKVFWKATAKSTEAIWQSSSCELSRAGESGESEEGEDGFVGR